MLLENEVISGNDLKSSASSLGLETVFREALLEVIPSLRAFARMLAGNAATADDLVQETLLKAWAARSHFVQGSSMRAWTHIILRNLYYSHYRRVRFTGLHIELDAAYEVGVPAQQEGHIALADLARALAQLRAEQREALILVGAGGMTIEEAAAVCNCPVGTLKSWVSRGRAAIRVLVENGQLEQPRAKRPDTLVSTFDQIMHEAIRLSQPRLP